MHARGRTGHAHAAALRIAVCVACLLGCPDRTPPPSEATPAPAPTEEFRAKAHVDAYARLVPLARKALDLADPLADAAIAGTPPHPRPFSVGSRVAIRKAVDAAWIEAADIRAEYLAIDQALLLRATRFALSRLRDEQQRRPSTRTDPGEGVRAIAALLDELVIRGPGCDGCDDALAAAGLELEAATSDLGATTPARARAAAEDCAALAERVTIWRRAHADPDGLPGATALATALERNRDRLLAIATAIADAPIAPDDARIDPPRAGAQVVRVRDKLGATELRRWLDTHESETREAKALFAGLMGAATQLGTLAAVAAPPPPAEPKSVDTERCSALWGELETYAKTQPALVAQLDCTAARTRLWLGERATDDELRLLLVRYGIVEPTRRSTRSRTEASLARVGGDIAPQAHAHALALAVLSGAKQPNARRLAAVAAQQDVCTTMIALWVHGELGDDAALREQLAAPCAGVEIGPATDHVLARPYASFAGLGLALLAQGPADIVALERGWWLPIGLVIPASRPDEPRTDATVEIRTEPIVPDAATDAADGGAPP